MTRSLGDELAHSIGVIADPGTKKESFYLSRNKEI